MEKFNKNSIENILEKANNDNLIERFVEYMMHIKEQGNLKNKWRYLKQLHREIDREIYEKELNVVSVSIRDKSDEDLIAEINKMEEDFFNLLTERNILKEAEERLLFEKNL